MRRSTFIVAAPVALASLLSAVEAQAQSQTQTQPQTPGEFRIYLENDSLLNPFPTRTDRYYTHGTRLEWLRGEQSPDANFLPGVTHADWCSLVCGGGFRRGNVNAGYALGQNMYTPQDISIAAPQPNDRPWAGHLYGSRIASISYVEESLNAQRQDRIEVSLGIVGPASLAKELQTAWHKLDRDWVRPRGWDNQLRNEPILQLRYETALRWPREDGGHADFIARVRGNLGNGLTSLEAEVTGRIGWNLSGFGVSTIQPGFAPAAAAMTGQTNALTGTRWLASGNLFVRAGIKAVAHNITLDGNTFARNDIRIIRTPLVPEIAIGAELNLVGNFWLSYQFIHRGSEFARRNGRAAPAQEFGSVTLTLKTGN